MRISDVDPDELDDRPRRRRAVVVVGALAVLAAAVVGGVVLFGGDDDEPTADSVPATDTPVVTEDTTGEGIDVVGPDPNGFPDWGSDYVGPELALLHRRVTDKGIGITVQDNGDWGQWIGVEGEIIVDFAGDITVAPAAPAGPAAVPAPVPPSTVLAGWVPEPWCTPVGGFRVAMTYKDAVSTGSGQRYAEPRDGLAVTLFSGGYAEQQPFRVLVLQVADDVTGVSVVWADGAVDSAAPTAGWAALGTPGAPSGRFTLSVRTAAGEREVAWDDLPVDGDLAWQHACNPPPPALPPPGEQPGDPSAAEAEIRDAFDLLWNTEVPFDEKGPLILDDTTGVEQAIEDVMNGGFGDAASTSVHTMTGLVFVSPDEAWFTYDIETISGNFTNRFGIAYQIEGVWRITRAVICQDLSLAGGQCFPPVPAIQPPG